MILSSAGGNLEVVKLLLAAGADVSAKDEVWIFCFLKFCGVVEDLHFVFPFIGREKRLVLC